MRNVVTAILGGGQGSRLWPLTRYRAKPSVPVAGKFRLIDIPISNSLHADIDRIFVLTQFNSASLHRHISQTYRFDTFSSGFVNILAAEQSIESRDWYQGTADAVRQNLRRLIDGKPSEVLVLSGDQLYMMNLAGFVSQHRAREADITIAVKPVPASQAKGLGIMRIDATGRLVEFVEKPTDAAVIDRLALDAETISKLGLDAKPGELLASMGIYTFKSGVLTSLLEGTSATDFGREVIPSAIDDLRVFAFLHTGYWRDIGTIGSFHEASIDLTSMTPEFDLYNPESPIYTHPRFLPGARVDSCEIKHAVLCDGATVCAARVDHSILGVRALVREGTVIEQSVVMGSSQICSDWSEPVGIGKDCEIRRAILDLDASIGDGCRLINADNVLEHDGDNYCIRDGIIVVPKGTRLPPGTVI